MEKIALRADGKEQIILDYEKLRKSVLVLRAANHEIRQKIISLLSEKEKLTVTKIYIALRVEQSVASQHLAILRRAGIVDTTREGKFIHYSLNQTKLESLGSFVEAIAN